MTQERRLNDLTSLNMETNFLSLSNADAEPLFLTLGI